MGELALRTKEPGRKRTPVTKKECFFVWRGWLGGTRLLAHVAPNARMSRLALEVAILDLDPFQLADLAGRNAALAELARVAS